MTEKKQLVGKHLFHAYKYDMFTKIFFNQYS